MAADTKSLILSAALDLFAQQGYEKTTMRTIAKKVGIQPASIYYFFESKESLLHAFFQEFASNFARYRNPPDVIWKAAKEQPLAEVLSLLFYTFGSPEERDRMMAISRVILSLQYENASAQKLFEEVFVRDAMEYGVEVLQGLHSLGIIIDIDFQWTAFLFHALAASLFQENLRRLKPYSDGSREFEDGIRFLCSNFAKIIGESVPSAG